MENEIMEQTGRYLPNISVFNPAFIGIYGLYKTLISDDIEIMRNMTSFEKLKKCGIENNSLKNEVERQSYVSLTGVDTTTKWNKKICSVVENNTKLQYFHFKKSAKYIGITDNFLVLKNTNFVKFRNILKIIFGAFFILIAMFFFISTNWTSDNHKLLNYIFIVSMLVVGYILIRWSMPYQCLTQIIKHQKADFIRLSK